MNLRAWFSEQFGGIKEGIKAKSYIAALLRALDKQAGVRGAFGNRRKPFPIDYSPAKNAARGPRPNTWWKQHRKDREKYVSKFT